MESKKLIAVLPWFSGFYMSEHMDYMDNELEQLLESCSSELMDEWEEIEYSIKPRLVEYSMKYVEKVNEVIHGETMFGRPLVFHELDMPREYNFGTDLILVEIELSIVEQIFHFVKEVSALNEYMVHTASEMFTSRPGFVSANSPLVSEWGEVSEWNCWQIGIVLESFLSHFLYEVTDEHIIDYNSMPPWQEVCSQVVDDTLTDEQRVVLEKVEQERKVRNFCETLEGMKNSMFADRDTVNDAVKYSLSLFPEKDHAAVMTALGVTTNTLLNHVVECLQTEFDLE